MQRPDDTMVWVQLNGSTAPGASNSGATLLLVEDITERKAAESVLRRSEEALFQERERAQVTLDSIGDAVLVTDLEGTVTYMNQEAEKLTGWVRDDATGQPLRKVFQIIDGTSRETAQSPAQRAIEQDQTVGLAIGCVLLRPDGTEIGIEDSAAPIHDRDGAVTGAVIVFHDVAKSRQMSEQMTHLAQHDHLTGLANTMLLTDLPEPDGSPCAPPPEAGSSVVYRPEPVQANTTDEHGHDFGDEVLQGRRRRLEFCVRESETVCRRGDEFVILLTEIECRRDAAKVARKVLAAISTEHIIDGRCLRLSASVGISLYPDDGEDADALMPRADKAMYQAKASSTDGFCFAGS
ncbi:MAG: diguanylate cyclase [Woeseiaceae bacterium]|nr:diguanylate cyclase [Woeseiaceae bacterium]